jgi:ABC-type Mn2+/Zn2+ transport system ATPase subunit
MENPNAILRASGLSLGYGNQTILREINLEVNAGEFWFFLGQNGGGKTTLLRALLGLLRPQTGRLWVHPELGRRERIGFVPQRCDLNPTLPTTVQEFVQLGLVGITLRKEEQRERLTWALEKMGLEDLAKQSYWSLSGGQRQRALVARALVRRPTLLFLDEPTNNLDLATEEALLHTLTTLNHQEKHTLLFVTHNVTLALRYATHVGLVHAGTVESGPRQAVLTDNTLKRLYGPGEHGLIDKLVPAVALASGETA